METNRETEGTFLSPLYKSSVYFYLWNLSERFSAAAIAAAVVATVRVAAAATIIATAGAKATTAEEKNQDDDNPKTVVAISAEHKLSLSPR